MSKIIMQTRGLTKKFGNFVANDGIDLDIESGSIHAIAGENGAGKSTLMKMLYGVYPVTSGDIIIDGEVMKEWKPSIARDKGIGMVFQDFRLIPAFTVLENVFLSLKDSGVLINRSELGKKIESIAKQYSLQVEPSTEVWKMDLGQRQHIEILKLLLNPDIRIMIFDEPTSVLAPHEIESFLQMLVNFRNNGYSILFITHKINEILAIADRITILRRGKKVHSFEKGEKFGEREIVAQMLGDDTVELKLEHFEPAEKSKTENIPTTHIRNMTVKDDHNREILRNVTFDIKKGEILGIAGISGNGQKELAEAVYGFRQIVSGELLMDEVNITKASIKRRIEMGMRMVTEDPLRDNVVPGFSVLQNMALVGIPPERRRGDIDWEAMQKQFESFDSIKTLGVPASNRITRDLSGGNVQRVAFARAVISNPKLLIASYPSRGLDV
ncbi:MAG: ATP-binding cassette domain-containing protein, partial [Bacillota bacterium]|nr:ATP-binding cassette domain-containing protein [Bacillota bacterium]